ncbi:MAG: hypothetical protein KBT12_06960 [Bacteroidales bacterium]|nr:hypothetical protein [Candidatus Physcousia equi]
MNQLEELEAQVAKLRAKRNRGIGREKLRAVLNVVYLLLAVVGLVLYFFVFKDGEKLPALYVVGAGMLLKIIEFVLRFTA